MRRRAERGRARKKGARKGASRVSLPKMPRALERRVLEEGPESPDEVRIVEPAEGDPVVRVRGKTVGAWIDL